MYNISKFKIVLNKTFNLVAMLSESRKKISFLLQHKSLVYFLACIAKIVLKSRLLFQGHFKTFGFAYYVVQPFYYENAQYFTPKKSVVYIPTCM